MDVSIIIVSWNVRELLRKNLSSLYNNTSGIDMEVFVVDNNSKDDSAQMVKSEFPQVTVIENNLNNGFAKANNQAIKQSKGRYVLLLNPDMRVFEGTVGNMVKWMDNHSNAGVAGCKLVDENGNIVKHIRRFPQLLDQALIILKLPHLFPRVLDKYLYTNFDYEQVRSVDSIRGSFFMIRRSVIDSIGGLDERYFVWFEEVDYCKTVKKAGWDIMYTPEVKCMDYVGKSFSQVKKYKTQKMFTESMLKYFKKWHSFFAYAVLWILRPLGLLLAFVNEKVKK